MWNDTDTPLAYLITFRTRGTWLHGDERGSIDRYYNHYRSPYIPANPQWLGHNQQQLRAPPLILTARQRESIRTAIRDTCKFRKWSLLAQNVRTNHVHAVVSADRDSELVLVALKANANKTVKARQFMDVSI